MTTDSEIAALRALMKIGEQNEGDFHACNNNIVEELLTAIERLKADRDAVIDLLIEPSAVQDQNLWDVLLPNSYSPLGWSWTQDIETKAEAISAVRKAAGLVDQ
jgi:hypothetical protein